MVLLSTVVATPRINPTWINFAILPGGRWVLTTPPTLIIPIQSKRPLGPELEGRVWRMMCIPETLCLFDDVDLFDLKRDTTASSAEIKTPNVVQFFVV